MGYPPEGERGRVVIGRPACAQRALYVLVDEIRPEKSVVSGPTRRAQFSQYVPRHRDGKKDQDAGEQVQFAPASPSSSKENERDDRSHGKHNADQSAGKPRASGEGRYPPIAQARIDLVIPRSQEQIENDGELQRIDRL